MKTSHDKSAEQLSEEDLINRQLQDPETLFDELQRLRHKINVLNGRAGGLQQGVLSNPGTVTRDALTLNNELLDPGTDLDQLYRIRDEVYHSQNPPQG